MAEQLVVIDVKEDTEIRRGCCRRVVLKKGKQQVTKEEAALLVNSGAATFVLGSGYGTTNSDSELYTPIKPQCGYWHPILWEFDKTSGLPTPKDNTSPTKNPATGHTIPIEWEWRPRDCSAPISSLPDGHNGTCGRWENVNGNALQGYWVHSGRQCEDGYWYEHPIYGPVWVSLISDYHNGTNCGTVVEPNATGKFPYFKHPRKNIGSTWMPFPCAELLK